jgi:hypothetical protein
MCSHKYRAFKKHEKLTILEERKADAFSFGISLIKMGNLLKTNTIEISREPRLLRSQLEIFKKDYPEVHKIIHDFMYKDIGFVSFP